MPRNGGVNNNNGGLQGKKKKKKKHTQVESMIVEPMMGSASEGRIQRWVVPKVLPMIDGREGPRWAEFSREY